MDFKQSLYTMLFAICCCSSSMAEPFSDKIWVSNDEKTGEPRAEFQFNEHQGILSGRVVAIHKRTGETGICSECPGVFKNKPIQNMVIIWGLKKGNNNDWLDGKILDPQTGTIYRAKLQFEGDKLHVRGYIGVSLLGRTQTWVAKKNNG